MSMGFLRNKFWLGAVAASVCACSGDFSVPADFVRLYGDLRIAEREYGETSPDGRIARILLLEKYDYTAERFDSVAECIGKNPDVWNAFQDSVVAYVDSLAIAAGAIAPPPKVDAALPKAKGKR